MAEPGREALNRLRTTDPVQYLSPSPQLSRLARTASSYLYSSLVPFCPAKPPLEQLLCDEEFDAEQIWCQVEIVTKMVLPGLKRQINRLEKESELGALVSVRPSKSRGKVTEDDYEAQEEEDEEEEGNSEELGKGESDEDDLEEEGEEGQEEDEAEEEEEEEEGERKMVEDKFLKIKELEKFLEEGEAEEYGELPVEKTKNKSKNENKRNKNYEDESGEEEDEEDVDDEQGFTFGDVGDDDGGEEADQAEYLRYEDFFGGNANKGASEKKSSKKKVHFEDEEELQDIELEEQENQENDDTNENDKKNLSTHEKEMKKLKSQIEEMEKVNLEPKTWTMQGEVTAAKRPKNSALEVDLDFEHNTRPVPVITEEVTASLEEIIKQRIIDAKFDDVERAPVLPTKAPKELKELDETKSKKGLAELYEEDYAQKAGLTPAVLSATDALKKEADLLFKKICLKLDALSHFHFAPKPVIEDMSVQVNVPALAMEEIAPVAVSDAAMLAPEEIFKGKGDIKEDKELSQSERKRRRANKKRKFKANSANRMAKKPRETKEE
ncbi:hypothetical protein LUZ60_001018 [Juncus effusus]|nr:hypothetical protein LUZ60_001018 [Juncus effusus]